MQTWKVLNADGTPAHGGSGRWPLPVNGGPGAWLEVSGTLVPCEHGLHVCRRQDLVHWLGPVIYEAEHDLVEVIDHRDKLVVRRARLLRKLDTWTDRTARLFAIWCAEQVLPIFEQAHPNDPRPRDCLAVARHYADGQASQRELRATGAAAWAAAGAAAWAAAGAAQTDELFRLLYPAEGR